MKKLFKTIYGSIIVAAMTLTSCLPNNGGNTPNSNNKIKKSYKIVQDNINGVNRNVAGKTVAVGDERRRYIFNSLGNLTQEEHALDLMNNNWWMDYVRKISYNSNSIDIDEKYYSILGGGFAFQKNYIYYFNTNNNRVDSVIYTTEIMDKYVYVFDYDALGRIQQIEMSGSSTNIENGNIVPLTGAIVKDFLFSGNAIISYNHYLEIDSLTAENYYGVLKDTTVVAHFTINYSSTPMPNANFNFPLLEYLNGGLYYLATSNGLNFLSLLGLNMGSQQQNYLINTLTFDSYIPNVGVNTLQFEFTTDSLDRITYQSIRNQELEASYGIYKYEY